MKNKIKVCLIFGLIRNILECFYKDKSKIFDFECKCNKCKNKKENKNENKN